MTEACVLTFTCPKCNRESRPFGFMRKVLPYRYHVKCRWCNYEEDAEWLDSETSILLTRKRLLGETDASKETKTNIEVLENKIASLEARSDADRKEIQNLRQLIDLAIQKDIKELKDNFAQQDYDQNFLQGQITKLQETFDEIRKFQKKQDE